MNQNRSVLVFLTTLPVALLIGFAILSLSIPTAYAQENAGSATEVFYVA